MRRFFSSNKATVIPADQESQDEVDTMVQSIEQDLKNFTQSGDAVLKDFYGDSNPSSLQAKPPKKSKVTYNDTGKVNGANDVSEDEEVEEIKLSHQLQQEESNADKTKLAKDLTSKFNILMEQIKEYQKLNSSANSKLKASEAKVAELETKVDSLEDEVQELRSNGTGAPSQLGGMYVPRTNNRGQSFNKDMNKRTEQMRKALLSGDNEEEVALIAINEINTKNFYKSIKAYFIRALPFKRDLKTIHARFGASVASYFVFQRLVFVKIAFIGLLMLVFAIYHLSLYFENPNGTLSGYLSGEGYIPKFMQYSSFVPAEKFAYSAVVVLTMVFITTLLCIHVVNEHKNAITLDALEAENRAPYSKEVLCAWDFSMHHKTDISDLQGTIEHVWLQLIQDSHETGQKKARSNYETFIIYVRRTTGLILYLAVVTASFTSIIYLTIYASKISEAAKNIPGLSNVGAFIGPLALQAINAIVPPLLEMITSLEKWDSAQTELKFLLFRVYLSNTLNTLILTLSFIILMDPFLLASTPTLRRSLGIKINTVFSCRMDQAADGLFTLVGTTWAIQMASFIGSPMSMQIFSYLRGVPWVKTEFNIADAMVNKFSFLGLVFVAYPFAPLSTIFVPMYMFISFKFEKYVIKRYYSKPKRPFRGQQAALLYAIFYLLTYILVGLTVSGYFVTTKTMAKNCDIQDDSIGLCVDSVGSAGTNLCDTDSSNQYYDFWGKSGEYPANVCESACGPFVSERSASASFKDAITGTGTLSQIWSAIFEYPYVPWFIVVCLAIAVVTRINAAEVTKVASYSKERALEAQIQASDAERKKQEKMLAKLKSIEQEDSDNEGGGGAKSSAGAGDAAAGAAAGGDGGR